MRKILFHLLVVKDVVVAVLFLFTVLMFTPPCACGRPRSVSSVVCQSDIFSMGFVVGRVVKDCVAASERLEKEKEMQCCQQVGSC